MTQEDKQLLLKDLCARLPYGVKVTYPKLSNTMPKEWDVNGIPNKYGFVDIGVPDKHRFAAVPIEDIKPYLRPMSSMTDKEKEELEYVIELSLQALEGEEGHNIVSAAPAAFEIDFYNKHHIDYRGLIEKGLALEAPEGMY